MKLGRNLLVVPRALLLPIVIIKFDYRDVDGIVVGDSGLGLWRRIFTLPHSERYHKGVLLGLTGANLVISNAYLGLTRTIKWMI